MALDQIILDNIKSYDKFLSSLNSSDKRRLTALKMMYCIHMAHQNNLQFHHLIKQLSRFILKFLLIPFSSKSLSEVQKDSNCVMLKNSIIEEEIGKEMNIPVIKIVGCFSFNRKMLTIYLSLFRSLYLLFSDSHLNKWYVLALMHRLIDYLLVFHTCDIKNIQTIFLENDRSPENLALIHLSRDHYITTVKYDNWLIDPIHHNDIYCEYYFYPSLYHKKIIQSFPSNKQVKLVEGGFLYWDKLIKYPPSKSGETVKIIYFTQFGIPLQEHKKYISDILEIATTLDSPFELIVKIHPKEDVENYQNILHDLKYISILDTCQDIYSLIAQATYCFSIFSTITLEAKHIIENSIFINYYDEDLKLIDYKELHIDLITSKEQLIRLFNNDIDLIKKNDYIRYGNCQYPHSTETLKKTFCYD